MTNFVLGKEQHRHTSIITQFIEKLESGNLDTNKKLAINLEPVPFFYE